MTLVIVNSYFGAALLFGDPPAGRELAVAVPIGLSLGFGLGVLGSYFNAKARTSRDVAQQKNV